MAAAPITIRSFEAGDVGPVVRLILGVQRDEYGIDITAQDQPDLMAIPDFYQTGAGGFWVAVRAGAIVGVIGLKDIGGRMGALRKMFVDPSARGPAGAGGRLLDVLLAHAAAMGLSALYLGTTDKFLAAHRFYEKNGFDEIAADLLPASFPRMAVDTRFYRRALAGG